MEILRGDPTEAGCEAILQAIRSDGAPITPLGRRIEALAGSGVTERLAAQGESPMGTALLTPGGGTGAPFLIHVVLQSPEESVTGQILERGLRNALRRAGDFGIGSLALPPLGVGAGKLDPEEAAGIIVAVLADHLRSAAAPDRFVVAVETEYEETVFRTAAGVDGA